MRILYVSQYYPPEIGAPAARVSELAHHWVRMGHEVTVLTGFPNHPTGIIHPEYRSRFRGLFHRERMEGVDVVRTWLLPLPNRKPHERILNYVSFCVSAAFRGMFLRRPDVIIATSPQLLVGLSGWWLGLLRRAPVIFEVRDIWPDAILASGVSREGSRLARTLRWVSDLLHRRCDHIVVVTPAFRDELVSKWAVPPEKISIVQNGVETELFSPKGDRASERALLTLPGGYLVSYIGTIGFAHGLDTVVDAARLTRLEHPDIQYLIVGEGADKDRLAALVAKEDLQNVHLLPALPRERIPALLRATDVCLVLLRRSPVFETVIPTKMLEFMACARPIVIGVDGQARHIVEEAGAGVFVEPEDGAALAEAVIALREDPERAGVLGTNGRAYVERELARSATAERYLDVFDRMGITNT
jgi:colanic acid biosynthesis glycosyl transferase WcaI